MKEKPCEAQRRRPSRQSDAGRRIGGVAAYRDFAGGCSARGSCKGGGKRSGLSWCENDAARSGGVEAGARDHHLRNRYAGISSVGHGYVLGGAVGHVYVAEVQAANAGVKQQCRRSRTRGHRVANGVASRNRVRIQVAERRYGSLFSAERQVRANGGLHGTEHNVRVVGVRADVHVENEVVRSTRSVRNCRGGDEAATVSGVDRSRYVESHRGGKVVISGGWRC